VVNPVNGELYLFIAVRIDDLRAKYL